MATRPDVVFFRSPNFGYPALQAGRGDQQIVAIVDHIAQGTAAGLDAWFQNPASRVSAHFAVMRDGRIHQYVEELNAAWHAGGLNRPDTLLPWLQTGDAGRTVNQRTVGIEHEGYYTAPLTAAQTAATIALHRYLISQYDIAPDQDHIIGHYRLDTMNRKNCPGPAFPWEALFAALTGEVGGMTEQEKLELLQALDVIWGWSVYLENLRENQAVKELRDAVVAIKRITALE